MEVNQVKTVPKYDHKEQIYMSLDHPRYNIMSQVQQKLPFFIYAREEIKDRIFVAIVCRDRVIPNDSSAKQAL
jgi:hypothetical protein